MLASSEFKHVISSKGVDRLESLCQSIESVATPENIEELYAELEMLIVSNGLSESGTMTPLGQSLNRIQDHLFPHFQRD